MSIIKIVSGVADDYKRQFFTRNFWDSVAVKLVTIFVSVKVWGLLAITSISTWLLVNGYIEGGHWVTINGTVYSIIYGMREIFKISNIREFIGKQQEESESD